MSIINDKKKVFGNISALRTLTEGLPDLNTTSSFPSINNEGNSIMFLSDLIKSLIGYKALEETVTETLTYSLNSIESEVKKALKTELKSIVSCSVNPSLPSFIKSSSDGIKIQVKKFDFTNLMFVNPTTDAGKILYTDIKPNLIESTDFNTFLYQTIQNDGSTESWGNNTIGNDILSFTFKSKDVSGINPNNTLTIKSSQNYDNKTLNDLNNDFIDSISLFNTENLLSNIVDMVFGTVSSNVKKTIKQLESEAQVNNIVDKISNMASNDVLSDKFFNFTDIENSKHQLEASARQSGEKIFKTSNPISTKLSFSSLSNITNDIASSNSLTTKKEAVSSSLNKLGNQIASFSDNKIDHESLKLNFIQEIINTLIKSIVNSILSPKVILLFLLNFKIVYGQNAEYTNAVDFLKKNRNLLHNLTKRITEIITNILLKIALKKITELVSNGIEKELKEKALLNKTQLLSLVGVPQEVLRKIKGLL